MIVRRARPEDADEMARVHAASADAAYADIPWREAGVTPRRLAAWHDVLAGEHRAHLAEVDGAVVGVLNVSDDELHVIYVHPGWWGRGAGQALLERAHELLAETCDEATLTCVAGNARARRFYERNGWTLDRILTEPHFGGVPTEVARYRKRLVSDTCSHEPGSHSDPGSSPSNSAQS